MVRKSKTEKQENTHINQGESIENKESNLNNDIEATGQTEKAAKVVSSDDSKKTKKESRHKTDNVKHELKEIEEKLAEMQDKYIRLSAEFDNYRKRTLREKMELSKYGGENLLVSILPLMDDFERAMAHMDTATDCDAIKNGVDLIYGKFNDFLNQNGVKEIESFNTKFNLDLHEAVAKIEVKEKNKKGKVVDVVLKGYYLQDKVLRFSKVVVGD